MSSTNGLIFKPIDVLFDSSSIANNVGTKDVPDYVLDPDLVNIVGMSILSTTIPFTYFVIDDTGNTLTFTDTSVSNVVLTIPAGTYNSSTLVGYLNSEFTAVTGSYKVAGGTFTYNWFVNPDSNRLTVYNTEAGNGQFSVLVPSQDLASTIGFRAGTNSSASSALQFINADGDLQLGYFMQSEFNINLSGPNNILIHSTLSSMTGNCVRTQTNFSDLIGFVPVTSNFGGYIDHTVGFPQMVPITRCNITQARFYLTLGNRTAYSTYPNEVSEYISQSAATVNYLPLQGESWQIAIRFYQLDSTNQFVVAQKAHSDIPQEINKGRRGPGKSVIFRK